MSYTTNKNPVINWRGTSDLTSSIRPIGAAYAISTSRSRTEGTEGPPLSCKTATRISNRDTIAIRATGGGPEGRKHEEASTATEIEGFEKSYRRFRRRRDDGTFFPFFSFFLSFLLSHTRQQRRCLNGPLNFHLSFRLNRQQRKIINQLKFQKNHGYVIFL